MLDLGGNVEWAARDLGNVVQVSAGPSGTVYVASSDGNVRALK
jgi:outer membrane protein assembly factor BamB